MVRLIVREIAEQRGFNMSQLQRRASLPMSTIQRYWHATGVKGQPLASVELRHIDAICSALDCEPGDLIVRVRDK